MPQIPASPHLSCQNVDLPGLPVFYWQASSRPQTQIMVEAAEYVVPRLNWVIVFLQASFRLSAWKPVCVFPGSTLISRGDYIDPRPLITHRLGYNVIGTQRVTKFCILAVLSFPSAQPAPFIPSPALCCVENRLRLLRLLLKAEMVLFLLQFRLEWDTFHFKIFLPVGMRWMFFLFFFAWMTKQLLEEGESCCCVTLCCLISLFFHIHFMAVTTAVEGLSIVEPHCIMQGGSSLTLQSFHFFSNSFLWAGQWRPKSCRQ